MENLLFEYAKRVRVKNRPIAVPYNYRILYKVTQIILIIFYCCTPKKGCSLEKMNMISSTILEKESLGKLLSFINHTSNNLLIIRFDPVINRAIMYALSEGLIFKQSNGLFKLTKEGRIYAEYIEKDKSLYTNEKIYMKKISTNLTEDKIKCLMSDWRLKNVES